MATSTESVKLMDYVICNMNNRGFYSDVFLAFPGASLQSCAWSFEWPLHSLIWKSCFKRLLNG